MIGGFLRRRKRGPGEDSGSRSANDPPSPDTPLLSSPAPGEGAPGEGAPGEDAPGEDAPRDVLEDRSSMGSRPRSMGPARSVGTSSSHGHRAQHTHVVEEWKNAAALTALLEELAVNPETVINPLLVRSFVDEEFPQMHKRPTLTWASGLSISMTTCAGISSPSHAWWATS